MRLREWSGECGDEMDEAEVSNGTHTGEMVCGLNVALISLKELPQNSLSFGNFPLLSSLF